MPHIQMRRDTAANWKSANPVLESGEWALETDTKKMKLGNGTSHYNDLYFYRDEDNEWEKPAEWIDIRSAALPNSVYFLVGHSADYSTYPDFGVKATISNSGTYDVYIDGRKRFTVNSGSSTTINWQSLALVSGWDVTYPSSLKTHVVRITPSTSTNTITAIQTFNATTGVTNYGVLWVHFTTTNAIALNSLLGSGSLGSTTWRNLLCEAVTCSGDSLLVSSLYQAFFRAAHIKTVPVLNLGNNNVNIYMVGTSSGLETLHFKDGTIYGGYAFRQADNLKHIYTENCKFNASGSAVAFSWCPYLEELPPIDFTNATDLSGFVSRCTSLNDTVLDVASEKTTHFGAENDSSHFVPGLVGLTVNPEAPFDGKSPQIDANYTGLDRTALVNLFKSLPYNVGYTVVGSPTIVDGVVSGFSTSNYLSLSASTINTKNFEYNVKLTTGTIGTVTQKLFGQISSGNYAGIAINTSSHPIFTLKRTGGYRDILFDEITLSANTTYILNIKFNNGTATCVLYDLVGSILDTQTVVSDYDEDLAHNLYIGRGPSSTFNGSIDLNNTYIKVNGVTWFNGSATRQLDTATTNVGNVTITNGVASGFSYTKYIAFPALPVDIQTIDLGFVFTTGASESHNNLCHVILGDNLLYRFGIYATTHKLSVRYNEGSIKELDTQLSYNTTYKAVFTVSTTDITISLYQNNSLVETKTFEGDYSLPSGSSAARIGMAGNSSYLDVGSIDLNSFYININGSNWRRGMVPMTKTISVVGCTGTPDISGSSAQAVADRNIVLNKGWALTYQ